MKTTKIFTFEVLTVHVFVTSEDEQTLKVHGKKAYGILIC
jgi:hypothetical protein